MVIICHPNYSVLQFIHWTSSPWISLNLETSSASFSFKLLTRHLQWQKSPRHMAQLLSLQTSLGMACIRRHQCILTYLVSYFWTNLNFFKNGSCQTVSSAPVPTRTLNITASLKGWKRPRSAVRQSTMSTMVPVHLPLLFQEIIFFVTSQVGFVNGVLLVH